MRLIGINIHPLKSGAIRPIDRSDVLHRGLADDRSWMVVDGDGVLLSAREAHDLFRIVPDTCATDPGLAPHAPSARTLRLRAPDRPDLVVDAPSAAAVPVRLHSLDLHAVPAAEEAHAWLRETLRRDDVSLVWCDDPARRSLQPGFSRQGDHTAFADAFPVTLASEASLRRLNDWIAEAAAERGEKVPEPLPMQRFRPNLVIDGDEPFAEDGWHEVIVGDVRFRVAKPVSRCSMTTIDPDSLRTGKEPIRTLSRQRLSPRRKTLFAVHLVPDTTGGIRVGDPVSVS